MLLPTVLWAAALVLLVVVVRGPERWHRSVILNLRPDAAEPTRSGYALLFWRHVALLVLVGLWAGVATMDALGLSSEELYETTRTAVDLVPGDELDGPRLAAELQVLTGRSIVVRSLEGLPTDEDDGDPTRAVSVAFLAVSTDGGPSAACVRAETTSYSTVAGLDTPEPTVSTSVTKGRCDRLAG